MKKSEAIELMKRGAKVRHMYFNIDQWIQSTADGAIYTDNKNQIVAAKVYWVNRPESDWEDGWSIIDENEFVTVSPVKLKSQDEFEEETALERYFDVSEAIGSHLNNKFPVPIDWIDERNELIEKIEEIRKRTNTHAI